MNNAHYSVSQRVVDSLSSEELEHLLAVRSVDLGWWTRFWSCTLTVRINKKGQ